LAKTALLAQIFKRSTDFKVNEKLYIEAVICRFCQTDVISIPLFSRFGSRSFWVRWLGSSFAFFVWLCAVVKMQMCYQMRWVFWTFFG